MPDIDIDFGDRDLILSKITHIPASIKDNETYRKHATGLYCQSIPVDVFNNYSSIDYKAAEERHYFKLDFLNVSLYQQVKSEQHLNTLMNSDPPWDKLYDRSFCEQLIHIGNHYDSLIRMPEAVTCVEKLAMFLAVIRPAKRHLIGKSWNEVKKTVWVKVEDGSYGYKKSHGIAYAHLVCVHMNLLVESNNSSN